SSMEPRTRAGNGTGRGDIIALQLGGHFRVATTAVPAAVLPPYLPPYRAPCRAGWPHRAELPPATLPPVKRGQLLEPLLVRGTQGALAEPAAAARRGARTLRA